LGGHDSAFRSRGTSLLSNSAHLVSTNHTTDPHWSGRSK
jgi:hypothetical protein